LEETERIIGNLEAEIVTLIKDIQNKNMQNNSNFWMTLSIVKGLIMKILDLDTIRQKREQTPKQQNKKHIKNVMHKKLKGLGRPTRKITRMFLHQEDLDFIIDNRHKQIFLSKKKNS
jgi:hypothetical protein